MADSKVCKQCKSEIPAGAKRCAACGQEQGFTLDQRVLAVVLLLVIVAAVIAATR